MIYRYLILLLCIPTGIRTSHIKASAHIRNIVSAVYEGKTLYCKDGDAYLEKPPQPQLSSIGRLRKIDEERYQLTMLTDNGGKVCIDTIPVGQVTILDLHIDPMTM